MNIKTLESAHCWKINGKSYSPQLACSKTDLLNTLFMGLIFFVLECSQHLDHLLLYNSLHKLYRYQFIHDSKTDSVCNVRAIHTCVIYNYRYTHTNIFVAIMIAYTIELYNF